MPHRPYDGRGHGDDSPVNDPNLQAGDARPMSDDGAYAQSVAATLFPGMFPDSFRTQGVEVGVYFEAAAITTLVLLGHVIELRGHSQTSSAIKALLGLAPPRGPGRPHRGGRRAALLGAAHVPPASSMWGDELVIVDDGGQAWIATICS